MSAAMILDEANSMAELSLSILSDHIRSGCWAFNRDKFLEVYRFKNTLCFRVGV